jgi:hypothetical protein
MEPSYVLQASPANSFFNQQFRRVLEDVDPLEPVLYNADDDYNDSTDGNMATDIFIMVIISAFICWNYALAGVVLEGLRDLFNLRCTDAVTILICPHWLLGIVIPASLGYFLMGVSGSFLFTGICAGLPYGFVMLLGGQLGWEGPASTATAPDSTTEEPIDVEIGIDPNRLTEIERRAYLERTLKFTKVVEGSIRDTTEAEKSFRTEHPKSDIVVPRKCWEKNEACSTGDANCTICFEDYTENDNICWSPNPICHHAFHKDCVMDWLMKNTECPVCRRPYIGANLSGDEHK